jgi:hypothetical protein
MTTDKTFIQLLSKYFISKMDDFCNYVYKDNITFRELMIAHYYKWLHGIYIYLLAIILFFNNNVFHLTILLNIILINTFAIVALEQCPLSNFEDKYIKQPISLERQLFFKNLNIKYTCDHEYEKTIELLVNSWILIALKCLTLICMKTFKIKVDNFDNIYVHTTE